MSKRRKRRSWSDDEKREICEQTVPPGFSVAQVARRYAMNANMIHNWLKDPRFAPWRLNLKIRLKAQLSLKWRCDHQIGHLPLMLPDRLSLTHC